MYPANLDMLRQNFSGDIILPNDAGYEEASKTILARGAPAVLVRPKTANDIATAITFACNNSLILSIRSGGHSEAGFSTNTGGLVIDLAHMNTVEVVDVEKHLVRIGAGAKWGDVARALETHHLALSSGDTTTVGVGGLTLGGGFGLMVRKHGLTIDSLIAAEIVTADGELLHISNTVHPDLFWAIRGGGGNFGIVTSFEFQAHPIGKVFAGKLTYGLDDLPELLKGWSDHMRTADEALTTIVNIIPAFGDTSSLALVTCCYAGDNETDAIKAIEPLKQFGAVLEDTITLKNYFEVLEEGLVPPEVKIVVNNIFAEKFTGELIEAIVAAKRAMPNLILQLRSLGGAVNRIASDATAFPYRDSEVMVLSLIFLPVTISEEDEKEALRPWNAIVALGTGAYSNFFSDPGKELSSMYPKATYDRLAGIKKIYDPKNIFNQNYNVRPV